jgi:hypothetical protein
VDEVAGHEERALDASSHKRACHHHIMTDPQQTPRKVQGKCAVKPSPDPRGRRDLFDVLHARTPGLPSDDSWMGNGLINPSKGKAAVPGPEQRRGRKDLSVCDSLWEERVEGRRGIRLLVVAGVAGLVWLIAVAERQQPEIPFLQS